MFISIEELETLRYKARCAEDNYKILTDRYWNLVNELDVIKIHLNIKIVTVCEHLRIEKIKGE